MPEAQPTPSNVLYFIEMLLLLSWLLCSVAHEGPVVAQEFVWLDRSALTKRQVDGHFVLEATVIPSAPWQELIASWSANTPRGSAIRLEAAPIAEVGSAKPYVLANWTSDGVRSSIVGQDDAAAEVKTDTLRLAKPTSNLKVLLHLLPGASGLLPEVNSIALSLHNPTTTHEERESNKKAWGTILEPPHRCQMDYPNGGVLCSPTSVSMLLGFWSKELKRPELDKDVPAVQNGVYDSVYKGTGNWSFNMAYAAQQPGITAYVTRFRDVRDLEDWIASGVPVAVSVSYSLLQGKPASTGDDGHLVVVAGFDLNGDPVFNDPGRSAVRLTYQREHFVRAWAASINTVYLVYPKSWVVPEGPGPWKPSTPIK